MPTVTGTHDITGTRARVFEIVELKAREFFKARGFKEIRTPILEYEEVFVKSLGETSDIVCKQMYVFEDRDGKRVVLRPEGTAPCVRAYIETGMYAKEPYAKLFYIGSMFRRERPQRGRYRQFHQIGCEIFGSDNPISDTELISSLSDFLKELNLKVKLKINSVGCPECRWKFTEQIVKFLEKVELCNDCRERVKRNPLRALDCKKDSDKMISAPYTLDFICKNCLGKYGLVREYLCTLGVDFEEDHRLVRGLDYYTGIVFEAFVGDLAVAAGGRYDFLVEMMGGPKTPAAGFAIGTDRVVDLLKEPPRESVTHYVVFKPGVSDYALCVIKKLREAGIKADADFRAGSLKSQMRKANSSGANFAIILGERERRNGTVTLRNLGTGEQKVISIDELV